MRNKVKPEEPPYKLTVPTYKFFDDEGECYVVKLNSRVLGFPRSEEELKRALTMITKALQLTGAEMKE